MATLRCREPFAADVNGVPRVITAGQLLDSADPIVRGRSHLFEAIDEFMGRRTAAVEDASAEPGQRRQRTGRTVAKDE